jgi:hypothetical protein
MAIFTLGAQNHGLLVSYKRYVDISKSAQSCLNTITGNQAIAVSLIGPRPHEKVAPMGGGYG